MSDSIFTSDGEMFYVGIRIMIDGITIRSAKEEWAEMNAVERARYERQGERFARDLKHADIAKN